MSRTPAYQNYNSMKGSWEQKHILDARWVMRFMPPPPSLAEISSVAGVVLNPTITNNICAELCNKIPVFDTVKQLRERERE